MHKLSFGLIGGGTVALLLSIGLGWMGMPYLITSFIKKASRLERGTIKFQTWENPTDGIEILLKVYFFNVTNPHGIEKGEKPSVKEIGPYVYTEKRTKKNLQPGELPDSITYREQTFFHFNASLSHGTTGDMVTFLSIPFVGMVKTATSLTDSEFILEELDSQLTEKGEKLFRKDSVQNLLFDGFSVRNFIDILNDPLVEVAVGKVKIPGSFRGGKFAIYKGKNGSDNGLYEVNTGRFSYKALGNIVKWNNRTMLSWWKEDTCNSLSGTDGTIFPPFLHRHQALKTFSPELCRTISMRHESDVMYKGVPGFRFSPAIQSSQGPHVYEPNRCFCPEKDTTICNRNGLMLLSSCKEGAPVSLSSPHFYDADQAIIQAVDGIQPSMERHRTYLDIEPTTGVLMRASKRLQFNVDVVPCKSLPSMANIRRLLFPIMWAEETMELPDDLHKHLIQLTHTQSKVETARWSLVGVSLLCLCLGILWFIKHRETEKTEGVHTLHKRL